MDKPKSIYETTHLRERGQIVIPLAIRDKMNLHAGEPLVLITDGNAIVIYKGDRFQDLAGDLMNPFTP